MLRRSVPALLGLVLVGACGGGSHHRASTTTTAIPTSSTTGSSTTTATTGPPASFPTTSLPCQALPFPHPPVVGLPTTHEVFLTRVHELGDGCVDHVVFDFTGTSTDPPGYSITYGSPPFVNAGSGAVVDVRGRAFVVVRLSPAATYDFERGAATFSGSRHFAPAGARFVRDIAVTDDNEGVVTWVIGLAAARPFSVEATGTPQHQLVVTIS